MSSEFGSQAGVDVTHHEIYLLLAVAVHGFYTTNELVIVLAGSLLLALTRFTVEYS